MRSSLHRTLALVGLVIAGTFVTVAAYLEGLGEMSGGRPAAEAELEGTPPELAPPVEGPCTALSARRAPRDRSAG